MTGLIHGSDLEAWRSWHESRHRLRAAARALRGRRSDGSAVAPQMELLSSPHADVLVCIEALHASVRTAVASTLAHLPAERTAILCPPGWSPPERFERHTRAAADTRDLTTRLPDLRAVLATGHFTGIGAAGHRAADLAGATYFVSQHGALTPFAPPLPNGSRLLAWSEVDADFWRSGRTDVQHDVVGSHLLWRAGVDAGLRPAPAPGAPQGELTYLGQMHGAELSRSRLVRAAASFCREHGATYRPHPSERDKLSVLAHDGYRRLGIRVEGSTPLAELTGPVVSVFSTGVLEAASQGRDAWVDFPRPPAWLGEFWERYGMHRFGDGPTPAPVRPALEPARRIAQILTEAAA